MRRHDREITDLGEIIAVIRQCAVVRLAFFDDGYPYIVPLNFGFEECDGKITLWFHCAPEGKKLDLVRRNPNVAFEMDYPKELLEGKKPCYSTMTFESICGRGVIEVAGDAEKIHALNLLMAQYSDRTELEYDENMLISVAVLKLSVVEITGKRLKQD